MSYYSDSDDEPSPSGSPRVADPEPIPSPRLPETTLPTTASRPGTVDSILPSIMHRSKYQRGPLQPASFQNRSRSSSGRPTGFNGKERHTTVGADPTFLSTTAFEMRPGVGLVYDWRGTNLENTRIAKQRQAQVHAQAVEVAYTVAVEAAINGEKAHQEWLALKAQERRVQEALMYRMLHTRSAPRSCAITPRETRQLSSRENTWCGNFSTRSEEGVLFSGERKFSNKGRPETPDSPVLLPSQQQKQAVAQEEQGSEVGPPRSAGGSRPTTRGRPLNMYL